VRRRGCRGRIAEDAAKRRVLAHHVTARVARPSHVGVWIDIALQVRGCHLSTGRARRPRDSVARVATGERRYQLHRDHRYPGTHPVARGRFFALTAAPQGAYGVASQREANRDKSWRSVRRERSVRWNASWVDSPFRRGGSARRAR
jgi:hypothetical protein